MELLKALIYLLFMIGMSVGCWCLNVWLVIITAQIMGLI